MRITKKSAQQIVEEIGKLVRQNINLMDETGHIIASNDPARIGKFHEGAYRIISQHLPEFYITPELENELPDVRRGINLPIVVDGQLQGVIGITGDYDAVIEYGQIVKKMAEILIRERSELDNRQLDLRVRSRFLEDWILGTGLNNPRTLSERGFALGIDIRSPRRCIVASAMDREKYTDSLDGQMILEKMAKRGMDPEDIKDYLMIFKYGMPPHGGLGIGLERLTMRLLDERNVRETSLFPRDVTRLEP